MIAAHGLSRHFDGRPAVEDLSFTVPRGALCALLGPNGAGKTTTVRMLLGLLPPSAGTAEVAGITLPADDITEARLRARAGLLTETPGFYDRTGGLENLLLFGRLYGLDDRTVRNRAEQWLRRLDIWEARDRPFGTWSKGMKQRLALIRAVLHEPEVLFLDEPTSGLDPAAAREVRDLIGELRREGRTILLCTHNLMEAETLADLVGIMSGRLLAFGAPATLAGGVTGVEVRLAVDSARFVEAVTALPAVRGCTDGGQWLRVELADLHRDTPLLVSELVRLGAPVLGLTPLGDSLEAFYLRAVRGHGTAA